MSRRTRIVDTMHRIASVHEQAATVAKGRAETARSQAAQEVAELEQQNLGAEAQLTSSGTLTGPLRELLWAQRTWVRREREVTTERLTLREAEASSAQARLAERRHDTQVREHVRDHVRAEERSQRDAKQQKDEDELSSIRWTSRNVDAPE